MPSVIFARDITPSPSNSSQQDYWMQSVAPPAGMTLFQWGSTYGHQIGACGAPGDTNISLTINADGLGIADMPGVGASELSPMEIGQLLAQIMQDNMGTGVCGSAVQSATVNINDTGGAAYCTDINSANFSYNVPLIYFVHLDGNGQFNYTAQVGGAHYYPTPDYSAAKGEVWQFTPDSATLVGTNDIPLAWDSLVSFLAPGIPDPLSLDGFWNLDLGNPLFIYQPTLPAGATWGDNTAEGGQSPAPVPNWGGLPNTGRMDILSTSKFQVQGGGVIPPGPSPVVGFIYSADQFPGPQVSFPPFNTRLPFQNYARAVPAVFIKRK